jgi:hypothetical protein
MKGRYTLDESAPPSPADQTRWHEEAHVLAMRVLDTVDTYVREKHAGGESVPLHVIIEAAEMFVCVWREQARAVGYTNKVLGLIHSHIAATCARKLYEQWRTAFQTSAVVSLENLSTQRGVGEA